MPTADVAPDQAPASKRRLILILLAVVLVVAGLSGAGVWLFLGRDAPAETPDSAPATVLHQPADYELLNPAFVVNIPSATGRSRYVQVSIALQVRDSEGLAALKVHMPVLRNELSMLLAAQSFETLLQDEGKLQLRQQATERLRALAVKEVGKPVVEQVLFTNFVMQ